MHQYYDDGRQIVSYNNIIMQLQGNSTVFLIDSSGIRHAISSMDIFESLGYTIRDIKLSTNSTLIYSFLEGEEIAFTNHSFGKKWYTLNPLLKVEQGTWGIDDVTGTSDSTILSSWYAWRGSNSSQPNPDGFVTIGSVSEDFLNTTGSKCPAWTLRYDCFTANFSRSVNLLRRKWSPATDEGIDRPDHKWFDIIDIIRNPSRCLIRFVGKDILLLGDSLMLQIWQNLVCLLNIQSAASFDIAYSVNDDKIIRGHTTTLNKAIPGTCPRDPSCHVLGGSAHFKEYNLSIFYSQLNRYKAGAYKKAVISHSLKPSTGIVLLNFGVHYGDMVSYRQAIQLLKRDVVGVHGRQLFWLETPPQHFRDGYFDETRRHVDENLNYCSPYRSKEDFFAEDWRNRIVEEEMSEEFLNDASSVVKISYPLYSQWDAHIMQRHNKMWTNVIGNWAALDCTHYCQGSGVFRFIISMIFNAISSKFFA